MGFESIASHWAFARPTLRIRTLPEQAPVPPKSWKPFAPFALARFLWKVLLLDDASRKPLPALLTAWFPLNVLPSEPEKSPNPLPFCFAWFAVTVLFDESWKLNPSDALPFDTLPTSVIESDRSTWNPEKPWP